MTDYFGTGSRTAGLSAKEQADRLSDVQKWAGQFTRREAVQIALEERMRIDCTSWHGSI